ncbi:MFS transporter [Limnohabitans sp.]|uniref:MFS transporter n=1 Tax=Limnohabitans sp. TaxID=1907725 RepID=UPI002B0036F8|nr:MFS transporter [Limnohabitans sp.]
MNAATQPAPSGIPWMALLSLLMAVFLGSLDQSVANTALPAIGEALQSTPAESVWVVHAYQLAEVAVLLPLAALGDRWGPRKVFLLGIVLFNLAALASASATQLEWLAFFRAIQGVGAAGVMSVNLALIQSIYPPEKLGRGAGMNALIVGLGYSLGPTVASLLLAVLPWPWLFGLQAPLGMVGLLLAWRYLPRTVPAKTNVPYDRVLALLAAVCFASLVFTLSAVAQQKGWVVLTALGLMLGSGGWLLLRQRGQAAPVLPVDLMRRPLFSLSVFTSFSAFTTQGLAFVALPFFFQQQLNRPFVETGVLMSVWALVVALMAPVAGTLSDRYPAAILGGVGLGILSLGMAGLSMSGAEVSFAVMALSMALCGVGFGLFQSPNLRAIMASAPAHRTSGASGMVALARLIGQASGAALVALCFNLFGPQGAGHAVMLGAFTAGLGAVLSVARLRAR